MLAGGVHPASFRDPSGFMFESQGVLYRQVNLSYRTHFEQLFSSGLHDVLVDRGLLIPVRDIGPGKARSSDGFTVLKPEKVAFISYPYEWCFSQLKDAALCVLSIQELALEHGMILKDASAFNMQFHEGRPVLIDTLSFETYVPGDPWMAYRQFCSHFLAPLALMANRDVRLGRLTQLHIDGIPLDLASRLLPLRTRYSFGLQLHIHAHARVQQHYAREGADEVKRRSVGRAALRGLIDSLRSCICRLKWRPAGTEWGDYYNDTNYSDRANQHKTEIVRGFLAQLPQKPASACDLGANTGRFTRILTRLGIPTVAFDVDLAAVDLCYTEAREKREKTLLPLVMDLTNPSPDLGWSLMERTSFCHRARSDLVMALALVHHLAISNNVPLSRMAQFFATLGDNLIIEFVPKEDSQVQRLLRTRKDVFTQYSKAQFEAAFGGFFSIRESMAIEQSRRTMYLMCRHGCR